MVRQKPQEAARRKQKDLYNCQCIHGTVYSGKVSSWNVRLNIEKKPRTIHNNFDLSVIQMREQRT